MTSDEAILLAKNVANEEGWLWKEPVRAIKKRQWWVGDAYWQVVSNSGMRGSSVRVKIDDKSGKILNKGYLPR